MKVSVLHVEISDFFAIVAMSPILACRINTCGKNTSGQILSPKSGAQTQTNWLFTQILKPSTRTLPLRFNCTAL